jgi:hypothetical protein
MGIEWELMTTQSGRILVGALDRIVYSSANYWAAMLSDLAAALAFLVIGLNRFSGPWVVAGGIVIAGFMSSGLLEYVLHRWVLHGLPSMAKRGHAQHPSASPTVRRLANFSTTWRAASMAVKSSAGMLIDDARGEMAVRGRFRAPWGGTLATVPSTI